MDERIANVRDFYENVLVVRYELAVAHTNILNEEISEKSPMPARDLIAMANRADAMRENMLLLEQQAMAVHEVLYGRIHVRLKAETDCGFMVWLAEQRFCADASNITTLRDIYTAFHKL